MTKRKWIDWKNDDCPNCGGCVEVYTDAKQDNLFPSAYDGDPAKCLECKWEGCVEVDADDEGIGRAKLSDGNIDELDKNDDGPDPD